MVISLSQIMSQKHELMEVSNFPVETCQLHAVVLDFVKLTVKSVLNMLIQKHRREICAGCETSHQPQRRHTCVSPLERHYFFKYYDHLSKRFWNGHFIPILMQILRLEGFTPDTHRLMGATEAYLHELREANDIEHALFEMEDTVIGVKRTSVDHVLNQKFHLWI